MKKFLAGVAVLVSLVPAVGHAASGSCTGLAPVIASCRVTFVASGGGTESASSLGPYDGTLHAVAS